MSTMVRCAIYTRKSSEEGLEQGFNSLHAQREACEAYVLSQAGEGWVAIRTAYDDGGFSGGSIERPGLRALLTDIERGLIDVVVVYKVDRLTRSLADFAKIVDQLDRAGASFVSVTQAFNTTTSMGRLTLNVLLSFAQFEREVTGERIRDKIAASKAKGMWMGGGVPHGYDRPSDPQRRALVVNEPEAETVRMIFQKYLELGSVHRLRDWLEDSGAKSKITVSAKGISRGGVPFNRGSLFHLLRNRVYVGDIVHREKVFPGLHPPIVEKAVFDEVQARLSSQATHHRTRTTRVSSMMLKGLLFDADGGPMSPSFTPGRNGQLYRYYVSSPLQTGRHKTPSDQGVWRVPADLVEGMVEKSLQRLAGKARIDVRECVVRAELYTSTLQVVVRRQSLFKQNGDRDAELETLQRRLGGGERISHEACDPHLIRLTLPCRFRTQRGRVRIVDETTGAPTSSTSPDASLIKALRAAHALVALDTDSKVGRPENSHIKGVSGVYARYILPMTFLAPDIQAMILEGRQPPTITMGVLRGMSLPPLWEDQRRAFGIST